MAVTEANLQDRLGGVAVLLEKGCESESLQLIWVDQGYTGARFTKAIAKICGAKVEVALAHGGRIPSVTETMGGRATFGWLGRYRRLSKDYELLPEVSEAMIYGAMVQMMLNRLAS